MMLVVGAAYVTPAPMVAAEAPNTCAVAPESPATPSPRGCPHLRQKLESSMYWLPHLLQWDANAIALCHACDLENDAGEF